MCRYEASRRVASRSVGCPNEQAVHLASSDRHGPLDHWDPKRARWHLHFTPTSASWLDLVEGWFSVLTRRALRDAIFTSTAD